MQQQQGCGVADLARQHQQDEEELRQHMALLLQQIQVPIVLCAPLFLTPSRVLFIHRVHFSSRDIDEAPVQNLSYTISFTSIVSLSTVRGIILHQVREEAENRLLQQRREEGELERRQLVVVCEMLEQLQQQQDQQQRHMRELLQAALAQHKAQQRGGAEQKEEAETPRIANAIPVPAPSAAAPDAVIAVVKEEGMAGNRTQEQQQAVAHPLQQLEGSGERQPLLSQPRLSDEVRSPSVIPPVLDLWKHQHQQSEAQQNQPQQLLKQQQLEAAAREQYIRKQQQFEEDERRKHKAEAEAGPSPQQAAASAAGRKSWGGASPPAPSAPVIADDRLRVITSGGSLAIGDVASSPLAPASASASLPGLSSQQLRQHELPSLHTAAQPPPLVPQRRLSGTPPQQQQQQQQPGPRLAGSGSVSHPSQPPSRSTAPPPQQLQGLPTHLAGSEFRRVVTSSVGPTLSPNEEVSQATPTHPYKDAAALAAAVRPPATAVVTAPDPLLQVRGAVGVGC